MSNITSHLHLIVFGRYPKVGVTKTRLIPILGPAGAAALQKRLTERTVSTATIATAKKKFRLYFCHAGGDQRRIERWLGHKNIDCVPQAEGDLGHRMYQAVKTAFEKGARRVVLVGTDIPGLDAEALINAFDRLDHHDLVLGPSTDGGYWLVGMRRLEDVFTGIAWSGADVLASTLALAEKKRLTFDLLDPLTDLDTPEDLAQEMGCRHASAPYLSVIIPTLNEAGRIDRTLVSTASEDSQIIVSDGGSKDRTVEIARTRGALVICGKRGRAGQQNRGAAVAQGEVLLFLHADTRLPSNYVDQIFDTLMERRTVLGAFRFAIDIHSPVTKWIAFWANLRSKWLQLPYGDQGLFMRRVDFQKIGGFPDVPIAEDLFLVRRMGENGRVALAPATAVTSARRWKNMGPLRTTLINTVIACGCLAGVSPSRLSPLYRPPAKKN